MNWKKLNKLFEIFSLIKLLNLNIFKIYFKCSKQRKEDKK